MHAGWKGAVLGVALIGCTAMAAVAAEAPGRFDDEIRKFELLDQRQPPPARPILFTGSSSVRMWPRLEADFPGYTVLNRGFGGSTMAEQLHYFDRVVKRYRPRMIVIYQGDNDLSRGMSPAEVAEDFVAFFDRVDTELPGTPVVLLAVKPSPDRRALLDAQRELNRRLEAFARHRKGVHYVDTFTPMLNRDGEPDPAWFKSDQLHLNDAGYALWAPRVAAVLPPRSRR